LSQRGLIPAAGTGTPRLDGLDALRGFAALAVVIFHYANRSVAIYPELGRQVGVARWGQYGVHLFFVISGFVIFMTLQRATPRSFLVSRFIRLYPIYWVCALITLVTVAVVGLPGREVSASDAAVNVTMLQSFLGAELIDGAYWTLAAELAFYAQVGFLFFLGLLTPSRSTLVMYAWVSLVTAMELAGVLFDPLRGLALIPGVLWMPLFVAGMALFRIWTGDRSLGIMGLPVYCVLAMLLKGSEVAVASAVAIALVGATLVISSRTTFRTLKTPMIFLGAISYPLYLIHQNLGYVVLRQLEHLGWAQGPSVVAALVLIVALAAGLTYFVDIPIRKALKKRLLTAPRVRSHSV